MFLSCDSLSKIPNIKHGFFGRIGGVSDGIYSSLNAGFGSDDAAENIIENRRRIVTALGFSDDTQLNTLSQIHSNKVIAMNAPFDNQQNTIEADGLVTNQSNIIIGILTADCTPVLFCDTEEKIIGAAHAGWQGAKSGILENTISAMEKLGAKRESIIATIGPCIAQKSYEVGAEFYQNFMAESLENDDFFSSSANDKYQFNLPAYVTNKLAKSNINNINIVYGDTCGDAKRFFSNRRRNLKNEPDYGRQVSAIAITD